MKGFVRIARAFKAWNRNNAEMFWWHLNGLNNENTDDPCWVVYEWFDVDDEENWSYPTLPIVYRKETIKEKMLRFLGIAKPSKREISYSYSNEEN